MVGILAQTAQQVTQPEMLQISLPAAITFGGILAVIATIIKIGDRLWGKQSAESTTNKSDVVADALDDAEQSIKRLQETCTACHTSNTVLYNELAKSINKLSEAMTKYTELQQASLKIEEFRHENCLRQLEIISGQIENANKSIHSRIDTLMSSIKKE